MENIEYILFGIIAVFFILQLLRVLGKRSDADEEQILKKDAMFQELEAHRNSKKLQANQTALKEDNNHENVVTELDINNPKYLQDTYGEQIAKNIQAIMEQNKSFTLDKFMNNSKIAFTMIQEAFSAGDKDTLKLVLNDKMYNMYAKTIDSHQENSITVHVEIVKIKSAILKTVLIHGDTALITVEFTSEQTNHVTDSNENIISGHDNQIINAKELWTFEKNLKDNSNKWHLSKTKNLV